MYSRRDFAKIAIAGVPFAASLVEAKIKSVFGGVHLGVQTYSFRDFAPEGILDAIIKTMTELGVGECEMFGMHAMPAELNPMRAMMGGRPPGQPPDEATKQKMAEARKKIDEEARKWHLSVSMDYFKDIRNRFKKAGIEIYGYNGLRFGTDEEIDRTFQQAKALGARLLTWSGTLSAAKRVAPFAEKHKFPVAMHGHSNVKDPEQFATPESFTKTMAMSKYFVVNLDLGHYVAAGFDPIAFLREHHARTPLLHLKDRKKNQGPNTPFGEGDTPITEVLQLVKRNRWPIRAYIEYEYRGTDTSPAEVKKCLDYAKAALA